MPEADWTDKQTEFVMRSLPALASRSPREVLRALARLGEVMDARPLDFNDVREAARALPTTMDLAHWSESEMRWQVGKMVRAGKDVRLAVAEHVARFGVEELTAALANGLGVPFDVE